ncbi:MULTISPECIES: LLM class flavin-dependent oxidoreductase [unclassified Streptomyces]|uniref:LLM class flavin-dependent oxidoreductase n=2 Tax=Streptomyces TaxID=1883 RepID=UPI002253C579|nr:MULTISPECIES: LLM class flavin-dependent oxidoreductase [unclassified Streptomyces]MCX5106359.1 LLM class flavin-dependent oxidoreductase [Streptomyces sp. NBC_00439]WSP52771.1 LLM class flavin-dependent oxidoreductase [Streptomyces sp. NBC_01243]
MPERLTHKLWFGIGPGVAVADAPQVVRSVEYADRTGLDFFALSDHPYYGDRLEAYSTLALLLGRTRNITGVTTVTNLPTRPVPLLARTLSTLSALTGGRVVLGLGAGGYWDDIARFGVTRLDPAAAVRALEEAIGLIQALSGGGAPVTLDGEFTRIAALDPAPGPAPLIWTGSVGPKSLAVTGRSADGWIPGNAADWHSDRYRSSRPLIDEAARAAGRDPADIATVFNLPARITDSAAAAPRDRSGRWLGGSVAQWITELTEAVLEHGASGFVYFASGDPSGQIGLGRWAEEIVPAVREAVAKG